MANTQEQQIKSVYKDEATQKMLNEPLKDPSGVDPEDQQFLQLIVNLINEGKINIYSPSSLLNEPVYLSLDDDKKSKADMEANNLITAIREIKDLYDNGFTETFQIKNLVAKLRDNKERIEAVAGDIFII
ncbi:hypothetical protein KJ632_03750 [Patescibacteria group bacterium]|nr:hypothetical protein [Patescibacteria group bacterium]